MKIRDVLEKHDRYKASLILEYLFPDREIDLLLDGEIALSPDQVKAYLDLLEKNKSQPIQYLLGKSHFYGREFLVNENVLIPRWDTEILLACILERLDTSSCLEVLELGTGSGILAISLALESSFQVQAVDISPQALAIAQANARRLGAQVNFGQSDLFDQVTGTFDLLVSNPPYISAADMMGLEEAVLREPRLALYGGVDGLDFYRQIIDQGRAYLKKGAWIFFEIGYNQRKNVEDLFDQHGYVEVFSAQDLNGLDRVVGARWRK